MRYILATGSHVWKLNRGKSMAYVNKPCMNMLYLC